MILLVNLRSPLHVNIPLFNSDCYKFSIFSSVLNSEPPRFWTAVRVFCKFSYIIFLCRVFSLRTKRQTRRDSTFIKKKIHYFHLFDTYHFH